MIPAPSLMDVAIAVNSADSVEMILEEVLRCVGHFMDYDRVTVALYNSEIDMLEISQIKSSTSGVAKLDRGIQIPLSETNLLGWSFVNRKTHRQGRPVENAKFESIQKSRPVVSHMIAPLEGRENVLGVLTIGSYKTEFYDEEKERIFSAYARLAGVALENLRLFTMAQELSIKDGLTGAFNHRHFQSCLASEVDRCRRYLTSCALFLVDIDHFKVFNDTYGHQIGDLVLKQTVQVLQMGRRLSDMVFRYGGEEFAVLLPGTDAAGADRVAHKVMESIRAANYYEHAKGSRVPIRVSMGCALFPEHGESPEALIAAADQAMYRAKRDGRDRFVFHESIDRDPKLRKQLEQFSMSAFQKPIDSDIVHGFHGTVRMLKLTEQMSAQLRLGPAQVIHLKIAALLHDIGELGLPGEILVKKGKLTARERDLVQTHPRLSESVLRKYIQVDEILKTVLYHHENYDGSGYPEGLERTRIPYLARILAVIDTFDALISDRPYRGKRSIQEAYDELRRVAGFQLDPDIVESLIAAHHQMEEGERATGAVSTRAN